MSKPQQRTRWWSKITRDLVLFGIGAGLFVLTAFGVIAKNPDLYPWYAGMIGLGPLLHVAENRQRDHDDKKRPR